MSTANKALGALPLHGIKVLDATSNIAGPFGGTVLGDLGAEVIKIETPAGDPARSMAPVDGDRSAYFHVVNRNKVATTIDLKSSEGRAHLDELLGSADVFLTNFLPERLQSLGLISDELMQKHPHLIIGNLSSYGSVGPDSDWPGYDATLQARTGIMNVTGEADGNPVRAGVSVLDIGAGTWLALGILAALVKRNNTGKGSLVETSLFETGALWVSYHVAANELTGEASKRSGSGHPAFSPYGIFATKNGKICIGVGSDNIFGKLCEVISRLDLVSDSRFARNVERVANATALRNEIESALSSNEAKYWTSKLSQAGVAAESLMLPENLLTDAQAQAMDVMLKYPDESSGIGSLPGLPLRFDGERPQIRKPAPHRDL
ncbi:MAG: CoA transferase [Actinobacteria bacterium]|nr:CoA transferase [Actinomycetota bacterium]